MRSALTATELILLRCPIQSTRLYCAVSRPATLFSALLTSVPTTWPTGTLAFDTGSPSSGTAPAGVMVYIGTTPGARDIGEVRLRTALTLAASGTMNIAELGQQALNLSIGNNITIVEDYRPTAKFIRYNGGWFIDYDVAYVAQNDNYGPLARLGPAAIGFITGGTCTLKYVGERSAAYSPSNSIGTWAWEFPAGATPSTSAAQGTTASPVTVAYTAAIPNGRYHSLTVTENTTTYTHIGHRLTFLFDRTGANAPYDAAVIDSITGGPRTGGYTCGLKILNTIANQTDFPDKAHIVLFAEDRFADEAGEYFEIGSVTGVFDIGATVTGATSGATGTVASKPTGYIQILSTSGIPFTPGEVINESTPSVASGTIQAPCIGGNYPYRSNVVLEGWVIGETVTQNAETGMVEFRAATIDELMRRTESYPVALTNRSTTPTLTWEDYKRMTPDTATLHFVKYRSTVGAVCDVNFESTPADTITIKDLNLDKTNLFEPLNQFWQTTVLGWIASDFQGSLYCEIDANIDETIRAAKANIFTMARSTDLISDMVGPVNPIDTQSQVFLWAVAYRRPIASKSPGDPKLYEGASLEISTGLAALATGGTGTPDQATLNVWAGNLRARNNNPYKDWEYHMAGNWRIDAVPQGWFTNSITGTDTLRALSLSGQRWIPHELRLNYKQDTYQLQADLICNAESSGIAGVTYTIPTPVPPDPAPTTCPIGYHWDVATNACVADTPPIVPGLGDAKELWLLYNEYGFDYKLLMTKDMNFNGEIDNCSWFVVSPLPTGFDTPTNARSMAQAADGSVLALRAGTEVWLCTNLAAIRAATDPSTVTATWNKVLTAGQLLLTDQNLDNILSMTPRGSKITIFCGTTGSFTLVTAFVELDNAGLTSYSYASAGLTWYSGFGGDMTVGYETIYTTDRVIRVAKTGVLIKDYGLDHDSGPLWRNYQTTSTRFAVINTAGAWGIVNATTGAILHNCAAQTVASLSGSLNGNGVFGVLANGQGVISLDGSTFTETDLWNVGVIQDAKYTGGGPLVWAGDVVNSNEAVRISNEHGITGSFKNKTGNLWDVFSGSVLGNILYGMQLVYY